MSVHIYKVGNTSKFLCPVVEVNPDDNSQNRYPFSLYIKKWSTKPDDCHFDLLTSIKRMAGLTLPNVLEVSPEEE